MPYAEHAGVRLYYEEAGRGDAIVFVHEFSGDLRSWEPQLQHFSRDHRCIAYNARGYTPSDVPSSRDYSQALAIEDLRTLFRHCRITKAHLVGCSMGAQTALQFALAYPRLLKSVTLVGCGAGSGTTPDARAAYLRETEAQAQRFERDGAAAVLERVCRAANRVRLKTKNPRAWADFRRRFVEHDGAAKAAVLRGIQAKRPSLYTLERKLARLTVPLQIVCGDEDTNSLDASLLLRRTCPRARLAVVPATGHLVNQEEPDLFNRLVRDFIASAR